MDENSINLRLKSFEEALDRRIQDAGMGPKTNPPPILYHYTTAEGLHGMLVTPSRKIWATHYKYLNNSTEYIYSLNLINCEIQKRIEFGPSVVRAVLEAIQNTPGGFLTFTEPYIACFCTDGNLLSQWRGYGARGGGYAIGLAPSPVLTHLIGSDYTINRVEYDPNKQVRLIESILGDLCQIIEEFSPSIDASSIPTPLFEAKHDGGNLRWYIYLPEPVDKFVQAALLRFARLAACMKNNCFESEQEWRLVHLGLRAENFSHHDIRFRVAGGILVPYIELPLFIQGEPTHQSLGQGNFSLASITHGPSLHPENAKRSLELLVSSLRLPNAVKLMGSDIPVKG